VHVLRDRERFGRVNDVEQVVRHRRPLLAAGLGGADVHAPVDLHGVGGDDLDG